MTKIISLSVDEELLTKIEELKPYIKKVLGKKGWQRVSRTDVIRFCIDFTLENFFKS